MCKRLNENLLQISSFLKSQKYVGSKCFMHEIVILFPSVFLIKLAMITPETTRKQSKK